ncbi:uncharacterized protein LOC108864876 [Galendromus occidentalis]|uniref:Uncharacterized protein LOC108864876 n=1 Tax=Galendromus occidentalis TaxID=34638 RepID=A0AAJ7PAN6_9ACAR|nr:uncharacterized protein LOC108864876 [Galendromus occidentalis]
MSSGHGRSAGDLLMDSLAENYEQRLAQLQTVIQDLTDKLETSSIDSAESNNDDCDDMPLSQCSSNENLATELSQLSPPRFASIEDVSAQLDSTSKEEGSGAPSSGESVERMKAVTGPNNTITLVPAFCDETEAILELDRLRAQVDNLDCQKGALELSLEESHNYCEQLTILLGRYISNQQLLKTILDEESRLLQATELLVSVVRLEKQEVVTNCRLSAPCTSSDRQATTRLKVYLDKIQEEKKSLAIEVQKLVGNDTPRTIPKGLPAITGYRKITFEEAEGVLMNLSHELRAKCSTLRIATPMIDTASLPEMTLMKPSDPESAQHATFETLANQQELLQLKEQVASLKLSFHLKERESRFLQLELASKENMLDTVQEQTDLLSRECQRLELALQRTSSHEPPNHSGCGEALSCPTTELRLKREKFLKRRIDNLSEVNGNLTRQCVSYRQIIKQLQRDNVNLLRRYERVKRKMSSNQSQVKVDAVAEDSPR